MFGWSSSEADLAPGRFTHRLDTLTRGGCFYFNLKLLIRKLWTVVTGLCFLRAAQGRDCCTWAFCSCGAQVSCGGGLSCFQAQCLDSWASVL